MDSTPVSLSVTLGGTTGLVGELLQVLVLMRPLRSTLDFICRRVSETLSFKYCAILLPQTDATQMRIEGAYGLDQRYINEVNQRRKPRLSTGLTADGPSTRAYKSGRMVVFPDVLLEPTFRPWRSLAEGYGYRSLVSAPLLLRGEPIGVLNGYGATVREYTHEECQVLQAVAAQASLAIELAHLLLKQQQTITELQQSTATLLGQQVALERVQVIHRQLTRLVIDGSGLSAIPITLAELLGCPVLIWDRWRRCMHRGLPRGMGQLGDKAIQRWEQWIHQPDIVGRLAQAARVREPLRAQPNRAENRDCPITIVPVFLGQETLAYLGAVETEGRLDEWAYRALEQGAIVLSLEMMKEKMVRETEERLKTDFLFDLLMGRGGNASRVTERARLYGLDLSREYIVAVAQWDESSGGASTQEQGRVDTDRLRMQLMREMGQVLAAHLPGAAFAAIHDQLAVMFNVDDATVDQAAGVAAMRAVQEHVRQCAPGQTVSAALSAPCRRSEDAGRAYQEVQAALLILQRMGWRGRVLTISDLGLFRLLLGTQNPEALLGAAGNILGWLDSGHQRTRALFDTLAAYLDHGLDLPACVEVLGVHHNTIRYRLRRVQELTGLDPGRPQDLLQLTFAVAVYRLLGVVPGQATRFVSGAKDGG